MCIKSQLKGIDVSDRGTRPGRTRERMTASTRSEVVRPRARPAHSQPTSATSTGRRAVSNMVLLCASLLVFTSAPAMANTAPNTGAYELIRDLIQADKLGEASRTIAQQMATGKSVELMFFQCLVLAKQNNTPKAVSCFSDVVKADPALIEAYNNLGVLYASMGQDEEAKAWFEKGLERQQAVKTLHANLSNLQASMSRKAYARALMADSPQKTAAPKLTLLANVPASASRVLPRNDAEPATASVSVPSTTASAPLNTSKTRSAQTDGRTADQVAEAARTEAASKPQREPESANGNTVDAATKDQIRKFIDQWAKSWSDRDVQGYLAAYTERFSASKHQSHAQWKLERTERIMNRQFIKVTISNMTFENKDGKHIIRFTQSYESDLLKSINRKKMTLANEQGQWKIQQESVIGN